MDSLISKSKFTFMYGMGWTNWLFGKTSVQINLMTKLEKSLVPLKFLKSGYIPFTYGQNGHTNVDNVSS